MAFNLLSRSSTIHRFIVKDLTVCWLRKVHVRHKQTIFSGIQPTGVPHLGNYFGAIKKWSDLQNEGKNCIFSIVDLHSITLPQDPLQLKYNIHLMTACLLACGINPDLCILFLQSQIPQHTELAWILGCLTTMPRLAHLPQYKDKSSSLENIPLGLFVYPVLQSADILLYKSTHVPVGEDQIQHIQLTQHLVKVFNNKYGKIFPVPEALIDETCARVKGLREPDKKMSKSDKNFKNRIDLTDSPDIITKRIKEALTDFTSGVTYDMEKRPGVGNLILVHSLCSGKSFEEICKDSESLDTGQYKLVVAEAVIEHLKPIQEQIKRIMSDRGYIERILKTGSERAIEIASKTMNEVKTSVGLTVEGCQLIK
ncbi:tryptophan--tRNA ligase, mitochondrial [Parasteatoda tepidariorum]|uniref:tryptophan--tRNA ligase, mitochondrial n=1 Tax=Parasteatoda tepidariorum TaxID=114398 RepID=UPI001C71C632|nr:tryptophan--tRNA ligase, mitochondrial [Parasteatoda tepidariorum]